jgi:hypothetical protein
MAALQQPGATDARENLEGTQFVRPAAPATGCRMQGALRAKRSVKPQGTGRFGNPSGFSKMTSAYE